jgi:hypothetical protein
MRGALEANPVKRLNIIKKQLIEQARGLAYIAGDPSLIRG